MQTKIVQNVESINSNALANELQILFTQAVSIRNTSGVTNGLRNGYIRDVIDDQGGETEIAPVYQEDCSCGEDQTCSSCDPELENICSIEDTVAQNKNDSPFRNVADLLSTVKKYEFISLVENAYSQIGNKPFKLKATKNPILTEEQIKSSAESFYQFLEKFLETNEVRVDEITTAFNVNTLGEVTGKLADTAQQETNIAVREAVNGNEAVLERIFKRSEFMTKYVEVIRDTTDYPIGVLWVDDKSLKRERVIKDGKMIFNYTIQADVSRVDPCYFWLTEDHDINKPGRAVFKMEQYTGGEITRWSDQGVAGSTMIDDYIEDYLETYPDGHKMYEAMLFNDHRFLSKGIYDVLVCRGTFNQEDVKSLGVKIPPQYDKDTYIPCEIYFSAGTILRVRVMETADDRLGVYTTVFRRKGKGVFGYSLHEFIYPFAKLYAGAIDAVDKSVGKSVGSIVQIDTGVIEDPDNYLNKDPKTGEVTLDLSEDLLIEFDSSNAFNSPNFKGVPITVDQLPSDLSKLLPVVDFVMTQIERISGIPSILVNGTNISSALRTTSNFNAAFTASAKVVQSLLRESETRILEPSIRYMFDTQAMSGGMEGFLLDAEPEILLSDTLTREFNDDRELLTGVQTLAQFSSLIPQEKLAGLVNKVGREVYNLEEDLIPGVGSLKSSTPTPEPQSV